jgi:hypothetical protein
MDNTDVIGAPAALLKRSPPARFDARRDREFRGHLNEGAGMEMSTSAGSRRREPTRPYVAVGAAVPTERGRP